MLSWDAVSCRLSLSKPKGTGSHGMAMPRGRLVTCQHWEWPSQDGPLAALLLGHSRGSGGLGIYVPGAP